mgnify:CR=1 FL=1
MKKFICTTLTVLLLTACNSESTEEESNEKSCEETNTCQAQEPTAKTKWDEGDWDKLVWQ